MCVNSFPWERIIRTRIIPTFPHLPRQQPPIHSNGESSWWRKGKPFSSLDPDSRTVTNISAQLRFVSNSMTNKENWHLSKKSRCFAFQILYFQFNYFGIWNKYWHLFFLHNKNPSPNKPKNAFVKMMFVEIHNIIVQETLCY